MQTNSCFSCQHYNRKTKSTLVDNYILQQATINCSLLLIDRY